MPKDTPIIDKELCIGCGACVSACPSEVLSLNDDDKAYVENPEACTQCGECAEVCPTEAISLPWE